MTLNATPCKRCGLQHTVRLSVVPVGSHEAVDAAATVQRAGSIIAINMDEDACIPAQMDAQLFVMKETATW